jgi:hypothetical protein
MDYNGTPPQSRRDTFLVIAICVVVGAPLFLFFNVITFGLFVVLFVMALGISALAAFNYFLWGRSFTRETAWEKEEMELGGDAETGDWRDGDPHTY